MREEIITMLAALKNNDDLTLKSYNIRSYKSGWQVADYGVEAGTVEAAVEAVIKYNGSCGIWYSEGIYYIDHSFRVNTKTEAMRIGREHNQISVLCWTNMKLTYC